VSTAIRDRIVEFKRVRASELVPHPRNWRRHPEGQRSAVRAALEEIGYADALLARRIDDGRLQLVDGHLRQELTPDLEVPVLVLDLTEDEALKLLVTLDPLAGLAETDLPVLDALLAELEFDLPALRDVALAVADEARPPAPEAEQDETPPLPEKADSKPGDLYILGRHRLLCGDSTKAEDVARACGELRPVIMVTDPPYGVEYDPAWRKKAGLGETTSTGKVKNDDNPSWLAAWKLFQGDVAYVWHAGLYSHVVLADLEQAGLEMRSQIIWRKPHFAISRGHYHWQHEPCWYAVRKGRRSGWAGGRAQATVWDVAAVAGTDEEKTEHGTEKPVECMARPMRNHGKKGDVVYDAFVGAGTSLSAAEQMERRCVAVELDPRWVDVSVARWEHLSGKTAERIRA